MSVKVTQFVCVLAEMGNIAVSCLVLDLLMLTAAFVSGLLGLVFDQILGILVTAVLFILISKSLQYGFSNARSS